MNKSLTDEDRKLITEVLKESRRIQQKIKDLETEVVELRQQASNISVPALAKKFEVSIYVIRHIARKVKNCG